MELAFMLIIGGPIAIVAIVVLICSIIVSIRNYMFWSLAKKLVGEKDGYPSIEHEGMVSRRKRQGC
jgi:hypothetical protein